MTKIKIEKQLLREFRKLSLEGRGEVWEYLRWMRNLEAQERLRKYNHENSEVSSEERGQREAKNWRE